MNKIGFYSLASCNGCLEEILSLGEQLLQIADRAKILAFPLVQDHNTESVDIAFVEGSVSTKDDMEKLKRIRDHAKMLVAVGSCACTGGLQAAGTSKTLDKEQYGKKIEIEHLDAQPLSSLVDVDAKVLGCPIQRSEFARVLDLLLLSLEPRQPEKPVCVECRQNENRCLLEDGKLCLGGITYGGCGAICPSASLQCIGCRGFMEDANTEAYAKLLKKGHKGHEIQEAMNTINNDAK